MGQHVPSLFFLIRPAESTCRLKFSASEVLNLFRFSRGGCRKAFASRPRVLANPATGQNLRAGCFEHGNDL
jgi:hypothetical protein